MPYLGNTPTTQSFISGTDYFNGTGAQTAFTLSRTVASVNDIQAVVNNVVQVPNDAYTISGTTITFTSAPSSGTQNVYVRYLSTTTQAITPSQGTVSWSTLNSDVQQDLGISFKNRIINGNMVIDQRNAGASVTQTNAVLYGVDRWYTFGTVASKFTAQQNAGSVTPPDGFKNYWGITSSSAYSVGTSEQFIIAQAIEGYNTADLGFGTANAKTITISFWVRSSLTGTFAGGLGNNANDRSYSFTYTISSANTWEQKTITIAGDTTGTWNTTNSQGIVVNWSMGTGSTYQSTANTWVAGNFKNVSGAVNVVGTNGATFYITGVQLEVGTQATTFTTAGGSYGAELVLCQRYCYSIFANQAGDSFARYGIGECINTTTLQTQTYLPVSMRIRPSVTTTGTAANYGVYSRSSVTASSAVPTIVNATTPQIVVLDSTVASGLTQGSAGQLLSNSNTTSYLIFNAEL